MWPTSAATQGSARSCRRPPASHAEAASAARRRANASAFRRVAVLPRAAACCPQAAAAPRFAPPSLPLLPRTLQGNQCRHSQHLHTGPARPARGRGAGLAGAVRCWVWLCGVHGAAHVARCHGCRRRVLLCRRSADPHNPPHLSLVVQVSGDARRAGPPWRRGAAVHHRRWGATGAPVCRVGQGRCASAAHHPPPVPCSSPTARPHLPAAPVLVCSVGNQPRVLPAVVRYLSDAGYKFDSEEANPGAINVAIGC